jgi:carbonic anhydrase
MKLPYQKNPLFLLAVTITFFTLPACEQKQPVTSASPECEFPLQRLMEGNRRFYQLASIHPDENREQLKQTALEQHPFAAIVCCSDSRLSPELIFDQGIGDLFVIRTAGNIIGGVELGSIEYAVEHLGVNLVMVMGHENCGAIKAYIAGEKAHGHIQDIVDSLSMEEEMAAIPAGDPKRLDNCVKANILHGVRQLLTQSDIIREKINEKAIHIVGARYDLDENKVDLLHLWQPYQQPQ